MNGLSRLSNRLIGVLFVMTAMAAISTLIHYGAFFLFNYFNLVGLVFLPIAKLSLSLTSFLLFTDVWVCGLVLLLFPKNTAR